ncbi:MAG: hypothetical protein AB7V58_06595 [Solirubrobacterales bacterium]
MVKRLVAAVGGFIAVLLVAVGGASAVSPRVGEDAPGPLENAPVAKETIAQFAGRFKAAAAAAVDGRCKAVERFNALNLVYLPCGGSGGASYEHFRVTGTATFGTGGIVDFKDKQAPKGATALVGLDQSGRYGLMYTPISGKREVGTKPKRLAASDSGVYAYIGALRGKDCDAYFRNALTFTQNKAKECHEAFTSPVQGELAADPDATPVRFGGVADFVFYGLSTEPDGYRTIVTLPASNPPVVVLSYSARPGT